MNVLSFGYTGGRTVFVRLPIEAHALLTKHGVAVKRAYELAVEAGWLNPKNVPVFPYRSLVVPMEIGHSDYELLANTVHQNVREPDLLASIAGIAIANYLGVKVYPISGQLASPEQERILRREKKIEHELENLLSG
ncbi:hypothetical protein EBR57_08105 [bacterium]|nr:hypothetical protein [bacterium]